MNVLTLELSDDELELLDQMTWYADVSDYQSPEMEELGEKIRTAIEELE